MSTYKILDKHLWNRKEHYEFFSKLDYPFFGITSEIEVTQCYNFAQEQQLSFFISYLYLSLAAAQEIENFRYRIVDDQIRIYDIVHAASTVFRKDESFAFSFVPFDSRFESFVSDAKKEIDRVQCLEGLCFDDNAIRPDAIHFSALPWIKFTNITHAHSNKNNDSCPKISFGKVFWRDDKLWMPISIYVHHALMDGYHVGLYLDKFQQFLNKRTLYTDNF